MYSWSGTDRLNGLVIVGQTDKRDGLLWDRQAKWLWLDSGLAVKCTENCQTDFELRADKVWCSATCNGVLYVFVKICQNKWNLMTIWGSVAWCRSASALESLLNKTLNSSININIHFYFPFFLLHYLVWQLCLLVTLQIKISLHTKCNVYERL